MTHPARLWAGDHLGRAFTGTQLENACPCPKASCGLVVQDTIRDDCPHHAHTRSMRQSHSQANCPGGAP
ncbi:hypothetical protein [Streptomyces sp. NPDC057293]|uniref:hypothetical protein n=1 Tax=unclassified Streptomyces TaxID=2593676 RepID=UPI0036275B19